MLLWAARLYPGKDTTGPFLPSRVGNPANGATRKQPVTSPTGNFLYPRHFRPGQKPPWNLIVTAVELAALYGRDSTQRWPSWGFHKPFGAPQKFTPQEDTGFGPQVNFGNAHTRFTKAWLPKAPQEMATCFPHGLHVANGYTPQKRQQRANGFSGLHQQSDAGGLGLVAPVDPGGDFPPWGHL